MPPYAMGADGIVVDLGQTDAPSADDSTVDVTAGPDISVDTSAPTIDGAAGQPTDSGDTSVDTPVEHVVREGKALYVNDSDAHTVQTAVAAAQWTRSPLVTDDDQRRPLFTFLYDQPGQPGGADGSGGIWHLYDGPVTV